MSSTHEDAVATASTNTALSAVDLPQGTFEVDADGQATYRIPI
jgi:hypothetical protein